MGAPKGNKYALGNKGGRPPLYTSVEEVQRIIDLYFLACKFNQTVNTNLLDDLSDEDRVKVENIEDFHPTLSGLAYALNMSTEGLRGYRDKEEFSGAIKRARQRIEKHLEQNLYGNNVTGTIFNLKNNFGWKDSVENNNRHSGADGGPIEQKWLVEFVNPEKNASSESQ